MIFAVLDSDNLVVNFIVAENLDIAMSVVGLSCVEMSPSYDPYPMVGYKYNKSSNSFNDPTLTQ